MPDSLSRREALILNECERALQSVQRLRATAHDESERVDLEAIAVRVQLIRDMVTIQRYKGAPPERTPEEEIERWGTNAANFRKGVNGAQDQSNG